MMERAAMHVLRFHSLRTEATTITSFLYLLANAATMPATKKKTFSELDKRAAWAAFFSGYGKRKGISPDDKENCPPLSEPSDIEDEERTLRKNQSTHFTHTPQCNTAAPQSPIAPAALPQHQHKLRKLHQDQEKHNEQQNKPY